MGALHGVDGHFDLVPPPTPTRSGSPISLRIGIGISELAPTIILIGELDDWSPAKDCERWMERRAGKGAPVKLVIYPGAYHSFDLPNVGNGRQFFGHWLKYDADAAQRSVLEMREFLAAQLAN